MSHHPNPCRPHPLRILSLMLGLGLVCLAVPEVQAFALPEVQAFALPEVQAFALPEVQAFALPRWASPAEGAGVRPAEGAGAGPAEAAPVLQGDGPSDDTCLACHRQTTLTTEMGGQPLSLTIDPEKFEGSVHGAEKIACVNCHTNITAFPHPKVTASSPRDFSLELYTTCRQCHAEQYEKTLDSVHQRALAAGNTNAAVCTDCHNPHTQARLTGEASGLLTPSARLHIPETCARCHSAIYSTYKESVHGEALTEENNTDVPTCIDCHGVHNIQDPTTATFRNSTPFLCAKCHTNAEIMDPYGLSTQVLDTYLTDFHGTTVKIFEETYPDQPTNKPVCTDCHGIHDIVKVDDPEAGVALRENLLGKCQRCHPDATANFPAAWMSHYVPSPAEYPLVYYVNLFYKFFIPAVIGGMSVFVISDAVRRGIERRKGTRPNG